MVNNEALNKLEELSRAYYERWGKPIDFSILPPKTTQESIIPVLERIVDTGESILIGYCAIHRRMKMRQVVFPISVDGRPVFKSNGERVLFSTACDCQITMLEPDALKQKYDAELILDKVKMNPYWQVGECVGAIYRLSHFPIDGTEYDYPGLYVFNVIQSEEYKKACEDPNIETVGKVCDIIVNMDLFYGFSKTLDEWILNIPDDIAKAVEEANKPLQEVVDKLSKSCRTS